MGRLGTEISARAALVAALVLCVPGAARAAEAADLAVLERLSLRAIWAVLSPT